MMTPAHVLRHAQTPDLQKVNPLVLAWQQGDDFVGATNGLILGETIGLNELQMNQCKAEV